MDRGRSRARRLEAAAGSQRLLRPRVPYSRRGRETQVPGYAPQPVSLSIWPRHWGVDSTSSCPVYVAHHLTASLAVDGPVDHVGNALCVVHMSTGLDAERFYSRFR